MRRRFDSARTAIANEDWSSAQAFLALLKGHAAATATAEYRQLEEVVRTVIERRLARERLADLLPVFERSAQGFAAEDMRQALRDRLASINPPHSGEVRTTNRLDALLSPTKPTMGLEEFAEWLGRETKLQVVVDHDDIQGSLGNRKLEIVLAGFRAISAESLLSHVLRPLDLDFSLADDRLRVSAADQLDREFSTEVYLVEPLVSVRAPLPRAMLEHSGLDQQLAAEVRLRKKLDQPISVEFEQIPLLDVLTRLSSELDDNVVFSGANFNNSNANQLRLPTVTLKAENVPAREILARLWHKGLQSTIHREAIVVTRDDVAETLQQIRFYPAAGLVFEVDELKLPLRRSGEIQFPQYGRGGGFGGALGGGGMGGFGGFMGGAAAGAGFGGGGLGGAVNGADSQPDSQADSARESAGGVSTGAIAGESDPPDLAVDADDVPPAFRSSGAALASPDTAAARDFSDWQTQPLGTRQVPAAPESNVPELVELLTATVEPEMWDSTGGPSSIRWVPEALGFIANAPDRLHSGLTELFEKLRATPSTTIARSGFVPARLQAAPSAAGWDFNSLIDTINSTVRPDSWDSTGGPGSIRAAEPQMALVVRQTPARHRELRELFALLSRGSYAARYGRAWSPSEPNDPRALLHLSGMRGD
ncbi:MAG: hypothetical protein EHM42_09135, partial [Planctomycetaceae bacterium]